MRRKSMIGGLVLVGIGVVLGTTVFRNDIAQATRLAPAPTNVVVTNAPAQAVPTREQDLDGNGNIKVHEQGTAAVNVTNSSLTVANASDGQNPFARTANFACNTVSLECDGDVVAPPSGKRWVLETVSVHVTAPAAIVITDAQVDVPGTGDNFARLFLAPVKTGSDGTDAFWVVTQQVRAYSDDLVSCHINFAQSPSGPTSGSCTVTGYLVNRT